jgi:hypothetical protein
VNTPANPLFNLFFFYFKNYIFKIKKEKNYKIKKIIIFF